MDVAVLTFPWEPDVRTQVEIVRRRGLTARVRIVGESADFPVSLEWLTGE